MAEILGKILFKEEISWEALVDRIFLTPLGIKNDTDFAGHNFAHYDRLAVPYVTDYGTYRELDHQVQELIEPAGPAGSICLSSSAMIIWMQFLVNRGQHARRQIVDPSVIEETWKPRIMLPVRNSSTGAAILRNQSAAYALGWITSNYRGTIVYLHGEEKYSKHKETRFRCRREKVATQRTFVKSQIHFAARCRNQNVHLPNPSIDAVESKNHTPRKPSWSANFVVSLVANFVVGETVDYTKASKQFVRCSMPKRKFEITNQEKHAALIIVARSKPIEDVPTV